MLEGDEKKYWYLWGFSTAKACFFECHDTRSGDVSTAVLSSSNCTVLVSDVYSGYGKSLRLTNELEVSKHLSAVNTMLADIMDFGGNCRLTLRKTDISELLRECLDETYPLYFDRSIELRADIPNGLLADIDRLKIKRVLQNILQNAFQAIGRDGLIRVTINQKRNGHLGIEIFNTKSFLSKEKIQR